jgi:hypothetical protein
MTTPVQIMTSSMNYFDSDWNNTHVRIEIDQQFYHGIVYIANKECHNRITH